MLCLKVPTDSGWIDAVLRDVDAVLVDHAHCEMKAASNALSLAARHPGSTRLSLALTDLAREEIDHFQRVLALLAARGVALGPPTVDGYAADLRRAIHGAPRETRLAPLVDRLLLGALIEARSCERFKLLALAMQEVPVHADLQALWAELFVAEARHYATFLDLAVVVASGDRARVFARLELLAEIEGRIVHAAVRTGNDTLRATMHG
jgi:tRNA-(ms[2]io[6]A)-hydroxylase